MSYIKYLVFYSLDFVGSILNLLSSLFGCYPKLELGTSFLMYTEGVKISRKDKDRVYRRSEQEKKAEQKIKEAESLSYE